MVLALHNAQSELEVGLHALGSGLSVREYAARTGLHENTLHCRVQAARALPQLGGPVDPAYWRCLAEFHAAPKWLWPALAARMAEKEWTVEDTREAVKRVKAATELLEWAEAAAVAASVVAGEAEPDLGDKLTATLDRLVALPPHVPPPADVGDGAVHTASGLRGHSCMLAR